MLICICFLRAGFSGLHGVRGERRETESRGKKKRD